jgi:hypothetical protein
VDRIRKLNPEKRKLRRGSSRSGRREEAASDEHKKNSRQPLAVGHGAAAERLEVVPERENEREGKRRGKEL